MARRDWVEEPAIQKIFKEHPIMAQLVMAESSGNPDAINKKSGAVGLAQLMPGTAKGGKDSKGRKTYAHGMYGKTLTDAEMRDPVKNLKFASEYLTALKKTFGNTEDALRAYNWGPGAVKEWIKQGRHEEKLPKETRNYVKKIRSRVGQTSPFVKAASAAERKRRGRPTEGVDPSAEARQLRLIKRDKGEDKMATPAQIRRLEKEIQMDKELGLSKKLLASKQARLRKMKGEVAKPVQAAKPDPKPKLITSSKTGEREKPSNVVSQAEKLLKRDRLKTIKKPTKKEIKGLELIKPGAAAARKTPKFINKQDAERTGVGRVSFPKPKDPLAVDIQGKGSKPTSKVREQQKAEKTPAATSRSDSYRGARRGPDTGGLPLKDAMHIGTRVKRKKRKSTPKPGADFDLRGMKGPKPKTTKPGADFDLRGMTGPKPIKKPKTTSADLHADAPKPGMGFDAALAAQKPGMGFDAALAARKAGPKKKKVTEKRIADDVEGYDPVTGRPSGEDAPKEYSFKDLLGSLDITRADDEPEYEGRKHGGKVRKTKKKAKSRKRAALRGWGKALRGY